MEVGQKTGTNVFLIRLRGRLMVIDGSDSLGDASWVATMWPSAIQALDAMGKSLEDGQFFELGVADACEYGSFDCDEEDDEADVFEDEDGGGVGADEDDELGE